MTAIDQFFRDSLVISLTSFVLGGLVLVVAAALILRLIWHVRQEYRGTRPVTCPETEDFAHVKIDPWHAALMRLARRTNLRVRDCSRWPERHGCHQACTWQVGHSRKA